MPSKKSTKLSKKTSKVSPSSKATKKAKNTAASVQPEADYKDLFYGTMSAIAVYVFAVWAIDSGSLWVYALTFASLYYVLHFYRLFIRNKFFNNNDKTAQARTAKN